LGGKINNYGNVDILPGTGGGEGWIGNKKKENIKKKEMEKNRFIFRRANGAHFPRLPRGLAALDNRLLIFFI
jgi:hypothetical protein